MKEHPILFSGAMVRAILDGKKTQTRRVIKDQPGAPLYHLQGTNEWAPMNDAGDGAADTLTWHRCPYGQPGDRLWVREAWAVRKLQAGLWAEYKADSSNARLPEHHDIRDEGGKVDLSRYASDAWRPSIHMPRWASRITLEVTSIRVERVQDISEADAQAEGAPLAGDDDAQDGAPDAGRAMSYRAGFAQLWDSINAARGFGWDANPWVWVIAFRRVDP